MRRTEDAQPDDTPEEAEEQRTRQKPVRMTMPTTDLPSMLMPIVGATAMGMKSAPA